MLPILQFEVAPGIPDLLTVFLGIPLASLFGAVMWWWASFTSNMWLVTLLPTILAAIIYWLVMSSLSERTHLAYNRKRHWLATNSLVCALVSAATFFVVVIVGLLLGAEVQALPAKLQRATDPQWWAALATWAAVVGFVGAVLGAAIGAFCAQAPNPSVKSGPPTESVHF